MDRGGLLFEGVGEANVSGRCAAVSFTFTGLVVPLMVTVSGGSVSDAPIADNALNQTCRETDDTIQVEEDASQMRNEHS